jgi:hypothetical protein
MVVGVEKSFDYFIKNDFEDYKEGEWIAIFNDKVVSHGNVLKEVVNSVKKQALPMTNVLITKVRRTAIYL